MSNREQKANVAQVWKTGPPSAQSTTVTSTYEFQDVRPSLDRAKMLGHLLPGALKDISAELGGGEF